MPQVILPNSLTAIGYGAFYGCTNLTAIDVASANPHYSSVGGVLFDKGQTAILQYPFGRAGNYTLPDGVTSIGAEAFSRCAGLTEVTLPDSLTTIGNWAFFDCTGLTQVILPNSLTTIGDGAFYGCTGLTQITLPDSLTSIGINAFSDCPNLRFVRFLGNAPSEEYPFFGDIIPFFGDIIVLYLPDATGWSDTFAGLPTTLWLPAIGRPTTAGGLSDGSFGFPVDWAPHRQVTVEACADLTHPDWQTVGTLTLDATGAAQFSDPAAASHPNRLYRLRTP
ncbi:MAG: leucine-rich repeat domain-containing protein [Verrucomicrobiae bacterium]|nr:leucine-rich repeat domain-containing protein [Verrucomicrobiae bacterium]